jgi:hypothetical protein
MERARGIVAQAREQDRLRRCAKMSALRALAAIHDTYTNLVASTTSSADQQCAGARTPTGFADAAHRPAPCLVVVRGHAVLVMPKSKRPYGLDDNADADQAN